MGKKEKSNSLAPNMDISEIDVRNKRKCLVCGEFHNGEMCPIIKDKLDKYNKSKKRNYIIGNILLECIKKDIDFRQILCEIAEYIEEEWDLNDNINASSGFMYSLRTSTSIPIDIIEYFAASLNCKSSIFFIEPQKTIKEYIKLLEGCFESCAHIDSENSKYIELNYESEYTFKLLKSYENNRWNYSLWVDMPIVVQNYYESDYRYKIFDINKLYLWTNVSSIKNKDCYNLILLATDCDNLLKDFFENELDSCWTEDELISKCSFDDIQFNKWMDNIEKATKNGLMKWSKIDYQLVFKQEKWVEYSSYYGKTKISIEINENIDDGDIAILYVRNQDGGLGLRFGNKVKKFLGTIGSTNERIKCIRSNPRLTRFCKKIDEFIENWSKEDYVNSLPEKQIRYSDGIVVAYSVMCHSKDHYIKPLKGIVKLLINNEEQIDYEIYVGYCSECNTYYCFKSDYQKMLKHGKPLCAVYIDETKINKNKHNNFMYKSQSLLNSIGYNVGQKNDLSIDERHKILEYVLKNSIFSIHDLIAFLNWLIYTRKPLKKYNKAVEKWSEDLEFVKNYEKNSRDEVEVNKLIIKNRI